MLHFGELEPGDPQMRDRLQSSLAALTGRAASASAIQDAGAKLSEERTVKLPQVHNWGGGYKSAEFVVALAPGVVDAKFVSGAQELKPASAALGALKSSFPFSRRSSRTGRPSRSAELFRNFQGMYFCVLPS